jgi:hypothetical protein
MAGEEEPKELVWIRCGYAGWENPRLPSGLAGKIARPVFGGRSGGPEDASIMQGEYYADEDWYEMKGWPKEVTDAYDQKFGLEGKTMMTSMDTEGDPKKPPLDADLMLYSLFEVTKSEGEGDRQLLWCTCIKTSHNLEGGDNDSFDNGHKAVPYFLYQEGGFEEGDEVRGGTGDALPAAPTSQARRPHARAGEGPSQAGSKPAAVARNLRSEGRL